MRSILYLLLAACLLVFAVGDAAHEEFFWGKDGEGKKPDNEPVIVDENAHPTDGTDTVDGKDDGAVSRTVDSQSNGDAKALPDLNVKAIFAAINRGEPFTGGIINNGYIDGLAVLGAEGLKVNGRHCIPKRRRGFDCRHKVDLALQANLFDPTEAA